MLWQDCTSSNELVLYLCVLYHFLIVIFLNTYFVQLFSFHIYNTTVHTYFAISRYNTVICMYTLHSHFQQEKNSISIYAFVLILCMFTM